LDNKAFTGQGGGIYFNSTAGSRTTIRRCVFERDTSWGDAGGAIAYYASPPGMSTYDLFLDSCIFRKNVALEGSAFLFDGLTAFFVSEEGFSFDCKIYNCLFEENLARHASGSGYFMYIGYNAKIDVEVEDCVFLGNLSGGITGEISVTKNSESTLKVSRCLFLKNKNREGLNYICVALSHGGGRFNTMTSDITNCIFIDNGGGISSTSQAQNQSTTRIANCTFFDNNEYIFVKTWDTLFNNSSQYFNDFFIDNSIIWEPGTDLRKMFYNNKPMVSNMYGYHINNTLLNLTDSTSVPGAAEAFGEDIIRGLGPGFQDSLAGDFRLLPCSPAVNRGSNDIAFDLGLQEDLDGLPRLRYGRVDIGAYEQQDSCFSVHTDTPSGALPLVLWPNPSPDGRLHFQVHPVSAGLGLVRVFDVQGRAFFQKEILIEPVNTLDLKHLPPGFYILCVRTAEGEYLGKWLQK
jgi:hypothetical protein